MKNVPTGFPVQGDCVKMSSGSRLRAAAFFFYNVLLLLRTDASLSISPCLISRSSAAMIFFFAAEEIRSCQISARDGVMCNKAAVTV